MDWPRWLRLRYCEREFCEDLSCLRNNITWFYAQVNVGTSGAEIGAAFGGNKVCLTAHPESTYSPLLSSSQTTGWYVLHITSLLIDRKLMLISTGAANPEVMLGNNTFVGVLALSTSPTRLPWLRESTSPQAVKSAASLTHDHCRVSNIRLEVD